MRIIYTLYLPKEEGSCRTSSTHTTNFAHVCRFLQGDAPPQHAATLTRRETLPTYIHTYTPGSGVWKPQERQPSRKKRKHIAVGKISSLKINKYNRVDKCILFTFTLLKNVGDMAQFFFLYFRESQQKYINRIILT